MDTKHTLAERIRDALRGPDLGVERTTEQIAETLQVPRDPALGDFAFPCFTLAKELRRPPPEIARSLEAALSPAIADDPRFAKVAAAGPYVNVTLDKQRQFSDTLGAILKGAFLAPRERRDERVMIEYSQPNTHKVFHVGHIRNVALGDACVRLCRFAGFDVVAANYIGDVGTHIAKCLWYLREVYTGEIPAENRGAFLGEMYAAADRMLDLSRLTRAPFRGVVSARVVRVEDHPAEPRWKVVTVDPGDGEKTVVCAGSGLAEGDVAAWARPGSKVGKRRVDVIDKRGVRSEGMLCSEAELRLGDDPERLFSFPPDTPPGVEIAELMRIEGTLDPGVPVLDEMARREEGVRAVLQALERKDPEITALWRETRQWSLDEFQEIYDWLGAHFDHFFYESDVADEGKEIVLKALEEGKLVRSEGAVGADLSHEKLPFFMLLKSDGTGLYSTKDIALARRKFEEFGIDRSVYVVDASQSLHFQQVFATLRLLGYEKAARCHHLSYGMVMLKDGKMSSRAGNVVPFVKLKDELIRYVRGKFLDAFQGRWPEEEIEETARRVVIATIRYGMLNQDNNKNIVFDLEEWTNPTGNTGPYLLYAYARTRSILREVGGYDLDQADFSLLGHDTERELLATLVRFPDVAEAAAERYEPQAMCIFLYDLSKAFSRFYRECSVKRAESEGLRHARAALVDATGRVLKQGLALIGIEACDRM